ncbi:DUF2470 domain-containing protein [Pseudonocardia sp. TRM90224]|uniref:DUF2470 domain-containing protein n=1 Tax=Pseudonocardia sp. TRM90224 TaxID=2812678 RepID=UPI001E565867|nr:DUF2470 domain-containing protein [Pseudonocardia sp. TRM90224]
MGSTRLRRPPAPAAAERARSIAARGGSASLVGTGAPPASPIVHHVRADGSTVLLLSDDEPVLERVRGAGADGCAVMLELTDRAPVELREPVRALLWITGTLRAPNLICARRIAVGVAEAQPHPRLLDLGHGATLVRLDPGSAVLSDAEGSAALSPVELARAKPDPFCRYEQQWLAHLEEAHPELFLALSRHLPTTLRDTRGARIRPLGVDRCGLRLRVEAPERDHDVRLAWDEEATTVEQLRKELGKLVGCPFQGAAST